MAIDYRKEGDTHFLEGRRAGDAGMARDTCPYLGPAVEPTPDTQELIRRNQWNEGWSFASYTRLLDDRARNRQAIVDALARLMPLEHVYAQYLSTLRAGKWRNPVRYWFTSRELERLVLKIGTSPESHFLWEMRIHVYLPRHRESYATFAVFDQRFRAFANSNGDSALAKIVSRYGELAAYTPPPGLDDLQVLVTEAGGSAAVHVY